MSVDIIARALAAKALKNGGGGGTGSDDICEVQEPTKYQIGGIAAGTVLYGKKWSEILIEAFFGSAAVPTLTPPSFSVVLDSTTATIGSTATITGTATFNRGSINPAYGTSGYRAGEPTSYEVNGNTIQSSALEYKFTTEMVIAEGENKFTVVVNYAAGEQPKDSAGQNYDSPYPAGSLSQEVVVTGVYPVYLTQDASGVLTPSSEPLSFDESGTLALSLAGEEEEDKKQAVAFAPDVSSIVGIQQYDTSRDVWDWIYGSPQESLESFVQTVTTFDINGNPIEYKVYTNSSVKIGPRQLKFFTKLPEGN